MLLIGDEEVLLWSSREEPPLIRFVMASDQVIPAAREGVVMARLESPLGAERCLI
jgi:hypothetical protein